MRQQGSWKNLWWEALIGVLIVFGLLYLAWYTPEPYADRISKAIFGHWTLVIVIVACATALVVQFYWSLRRFAAFWGMALAFLAALGASAYVWFPNGAADAGPRAVMFGMIAAAEFAPFAYFVYRKFHFIPKQKR